MLKKKRIFLVSKLIAKTKIKNKIKTHSIFSLFAGFYVFFVFSIFNWQDIARDVRETKVHYSPSEKDGVFVVEVARGADSNSTPILKAPQDHSTGQGPATSTSTIVEVSEEHTKTVDYASSNDGNNECPVQSNEEVLVHPPPNGMCTDDDVLMIDEDGAVSMSSPKLNGNDAAASASSVAPSSIANTGLSQSDLSISSSGGSNRAYCYGAQETYTVESKGYQSSSPHRSTPHIDRIATPEPVTVISDTEHTANEINQNELQPPNAYVDKDEFAVDPLPIDNLNENGVSTEDNNAVVIKTLKNIVEIQIENGNVNSNGNSNGNGNGNDNDNEHIEHAQVLNGIKTEMIAISELNGKLNGNHENGCNGNNEHFIEESNEFDSLMNLPAPPPPCDDIKQFTDVTQLDNGNMDSLPPPPPELVTAES